MSWITLQIVSMLLSSANSILDKQLVENQTQNPVLYLASFAVVGLPVVGVGVWIVPFPGMGAAGLGVLIGLVFTGMVLLYYRAMGLDEVSRLVPIMRLSSPIKLGLLALFLDDRLAGRQYVAFGVMLLGAVALSWRGKCRHSSPQISRGILFMAGVALLSAVHGVLNSHLILSYSPWLLLVWSNAGILLGFGILLGMPAQRRAFQQTLSTTPTKFRVILIAEQIGRLLTGLLADFAIQGTGSAALTSILGGIKPMLVLFLAVAFLGERFTRKEAVPKLMGMGLMGVGIGLLFW